MYMQKAIVSCKFCFFHPSLESRFFSAYSASPREADSVFVSRPFALLTQAAKIAGKAESTSCFGVRH